MRQPWRQQRDSATRPSRRQALASLIATLAGGVVALYPRASHAAGSAGAAVAGVPANAPIPSRQVVGPTANPATNAVLAAVADQFTTMVATRYQHHDVENAQEGTYFYDCVGMVTYTLRLAAPNAIAALETDLGIRKGFVPNPAHYLQWFTALPGEPNQYWMPVTRVEDLLPGDVIAWTIEANNPHPIPAGHALIAAGPLLPLSDGSYALLVYDSTGTPHGPFDTRRTDPRNELGPNGLPSGLGRGTIQLFSEPVSGAPVAEAWTVGTARTAQVIGIARALG
jgi:hypothetical protein